MTPEVLQKIISEEKEKLISLGLLVEDSRKTKVELLKECKDFYKKLNIKEAKLKSELNKVNVLKSSLKNKILKMRK